MNDSALTRDDLDALVLLKLWREACVPAELAGPAIKSAEDRALRNFLFADGFAIACEKIDLRTLSQARAYAKASLCTRTSKAYRSRTISKT